jgi:hypothetical protein
LFAALASFRPSTYATSFWKSSRLRTASKSGSFNSSRRAQPALMASRMAATDWSAKLAVGGGGHAMAPNGGGR